MKSWDCCNDVNRPVTDFDEFMKLPVSTGYFNVKPPHRCRMFDDRPRVVHEADILLRKLLDQPYKLPFYRLVQHRLYRVPEEQVHRRQQRRMC